jgi:hypothetical protein
MGTTVDADSPVKRLAYAFVALLAGLATLLLYLLQNALRARSALLAVHVGEPRRQVSFALELFVLYAIFSFVGWLSVGVPTALFLPVRCIARLSWPLTLAVGAVLGPPALLVILLVLGHGHIYFPADTRTMLAYSMLVSSVSFVVYVALLRKRTTAVS